MSEHREYKGFEINAHANVTPVGRFLPFVVITRHNEDDVKETKLTPDVGPDGFETEEEAIQRAMKYGLDAVDGDVVGFDPTSLL